MLPETRLPKLQWGYSMGSICIYVYAILSKAKKNVQDEH